MQNPTSNYIDLLKKSLIDYHHIGGHEYHPLDQVKPNWKTWFLYPLHRLLRTRNFAITKVKPVLKEERLNGYDWPAQALTMIGLHRLSHIEDCVHTLIHEKIPGDFLEAGVWRGGATILMRALLKELQITERTVWLADSFEGIPKPNGQTYPHDKGNTLHTYPLLKANLKEVQQNFERFHLWDEQVKVLPGWFKDTLPQAPMEQLALLRLDADLYESTYQALTHLYPKLAPGGFLIIDDYNAFPFCRQAVQDYRNEHHITESIIELDKEATYWRKRL